MARMNRAFCLCCTQAASGLAGLAGTDILPCPAFIESIFYSLQQDFPMMPRGSSGANNACITCCITHTLLAVLHNEVKFK